MARPKTEERVMREKKQATDTRRTKDGFRDVYVNRIEDPEPPEWLNDEAKKKYLGIFRDLEKWDIILESDLNAIALVAHYQARFEQIERIFKEQAKNSPTGDGFTYKDKNNLIRISPLVREQKNCTVQILNISKRLGLTPVDRIGLKLNFIYGERSEDDPQKDEFDDV